MIACAACFNSAAWITAIAASAGSPGTCDFGHGYSPTTWPVKVWAEYLLRIVEIYSIDAGGERLARRVQSDWHVFALADPHAIDVFLDAALEGTGWTSGELVILDFAAGGPGADHVLSWGRFVDELTNRNRFFPTTDLDLDSIRAALRSSETTLRAGTSLVRVRASGSVPLSIDQMGPPPPASASAGRANPAGIAYLYLSFDDDTAVHEARIDNQGHCSIATFVANRDLRVLNLADIESPDPFSSEDLKQRISFFAYLTELGRELSQPVGDSDRALSYVPTQYLCELAKVSGLDGVIFSSSLWPGGRNLVLFDPDSVSGDTDVRFGKVSAVTRTWALC